MARPPFAVRWSAEDTAAALRAQDRRAGRADRRRRLHGLGLLREGRSVEETAGVVGGHRRTVDGGWRGIGWGAWLGCAPIGRAALVNPAS